MKSKLQIDVVGEVENTPLMECNLYLDGGCISKIYIAQLDYERLIEEGFFLRDGKEKDSSGAVNTTKVYQELV